jgi:hypothetical protein
MAIDRGSPLAHQSQGRELTEQEGALARELSRIFGTGQHDFEAVAAELNKSGARRPSGEKGDWTAAVLQDELSQINASMDVAYAEHGIGA